MDRTERAKGRLAEIGGARGDPHHTLRPSGTADTAPGAAAPELPRISVDLALPGPPARPHPVGRDLEVLDILGQGGMGRVFLARQHSLDREVAIKTLHEGASARDRAGLLSEGTVTGHLEHPAIVPVHALGVDGDGNPLLVMKRVEGVEWSALLRDPDHAGWGADPRDRLDAHVDILMQVANAVHFAHSRNIVHRDIKPQNVLIGRFGEVYVCDWGIAVRTDREQKREPLCGTPAYMAPEMVLGDAVDARSDVYLLGATLHQILTGQPRNLGQTLPDALAGAVEPQPYVYPPSVPEELGLLANRATSYDRDLRPASAIAFRQGLADYLVHKTSTALVQSAAERLGRLRALVDEGHGLDSADADGLAAEARFALAEALRHWGDNPGAQRGMAELDRLLAVRRARAAELERMARDNDPRVARRPRTVLFGALTAVGFFVAAWAFRTDVRAITPRTLLVLGAIPAVAFSLAVFIQRRQVLSTSFNRRAALSVAIAILSLVASRALGLIAGVDAAHVLVTDALVVAAVLAATAGLLLPLLGWGAGIMLVAAFVAALWPAYALFAFAAGIMSTLILSFWFVSRG